MISHFVAFVSEKSLTFLDWGGYWGIFLLSGLDRLLMALIPGEIVLPLAGVLAGQGKFNFWTLFVVILMGNLIGEIALYILASHAGRWIIEHYGKYIFIKKHELDYTERLFEKHGGALVFWGRLLPVVRMLIAIPAGIVRMNFGQFLGYTILGLIPYNLVLLFAGYKLDERWSTVSGYFQKAEEIGLIVLMALVIFYIFRHLHKKHATHA